MAKIINPAKTLALAAITLYRWLMSPLLGNCCRFYPSCSSYALGAIEKHGFFYGVWLTTVRILKCHPWHPGGMDEVP